MIFCMKVNHGRRTVRIFLSSLAPVWPSCLVENWPRGICSWEASQNPKAIACPVYNIVTILLPSIHNLHPANMQYFKLHIYDTQKHFWCDALKLIVLVAWEEMLKLLLKTVGSTFKYENNSLKESKGLWLHTVTLFPVYSCNCCNSWVKLEWRKPWTCSEWNMKPEPVTVAEWCYFSFYSK